MILASILITSNEDEEVHLPAIVAENINSFKHVHPNLPHRLFTNSSIRQLIRQHFDAGVLDAYDKLKPFSFKADLAKYCIMYVYGGVYADIGIYFFNPWSPRVLASVTDPHEETPGSRMRLGLFRDFQSSSVWDTVCGLFSAPPRQEAFLVAIRMICDNVKARYYGKSCLCLTGPTLFGKAIASSCSAEQIVAGDSRWVAPQEKLKKLITEQSHSFVFRNKIIAIRRKRGAGSLDELGVTGGNTYYDMWVSRDVYEIDE